MLRRIARDPAGSGGAGGMLETRHEAVYDHRWRMIEVRRDETEDGNQTGNGESKQGRFERFYYHNGGGAGVAGGGSSVYIDSVIARDRSIAIKPSLLGERTYYAQNWEGGRGDVVQLMRPDGSRVEGVRYSAYGRRFNIRSAEIDANGVVDLIDPELFAASWDTHYGTTFVGSGDHNLDGYVDEDDYDAYLDDWVPHEDIATGRDVLTMGQTFAHGGNRKGYAAYEHEPWWYEFPQTGTPPTEVPSVEAGPLMQLARHRFYRADLGTWTRRDPLGYVDGVGLYGFVSQQSIVNVDPTGLAPIWTSPVIPWSKPSLCAPNDLDVIAPHKCRHVGMSSSMDSHKAVFSSTPELLGLFAPLTHRHTPILHWHS